MEKLLINEGGRFFFEAVENRVMANEGSLHYHNQLEIYYLKEGTCNYFIDTNTYSLQSGDIVVVPPKVLHSTMYGDKVHTRLLINCDQYYVPMSVRHLLPTMPYIGRIPRIQNEVDMIFRKIRHEYENPDDFSKDALQSQVSSLLILLLRSEKNRQAVYSGDNFVEMAVSYMQHNYSHPITLADVAKHCAVSCEHLSRSFKKSTGFGFSEYLTLYRLKQAEILLLEESTKSVSEIAYCCGFNDSNYFANRFKKIYGITPSKLRHEMPEIKRQKIALP